MLVARHARCLDIGEWCERKAEQEQQCRKEGQGWERFYCTNQPHPSLSFLFQISSRRPHFLNALNRVETRARRERRNY